VKEEFRHAIGQPLRIVVSAGVVPRVHPIDPTKESQGHCSQAERIAVRLAQKGLDDLQASEMVLPLCLRHAEILFARQHPGFLGVDLHGLDMANEILEVIVDKHL
jgi:hypothetical protein